MWVEHGFSPEWPPLRGTPLETWHGGEWVRVTMGDQTKLDRTESAFRLNPAGTSNGNVYLPVPGAMYSTGWLETGAGTDDAP